MKKVKGVLENLNHDLENFLKIENCVKFFDKLFCKIAEYFLKTK